MIIKKGIIAPVELMTTFSYNTDIAMRISELMDLDNTIAIDLHGRIRVFHGVQRGFIDVVFYYGDWSTWADNIDGWPWDVIRELRKRGLDELANFVKSELNLIIE